MSKMLRAKALILALLPVVAVTAVMATPALQRPVPPAAGAARAPLAAVTDRVLPACMFIGGGCGVAISPDGYVITNAHVVTGSKRWRIRSAAGGTWTADVVGKATMTDLALLKIRGKKMPPHLTLGDSDRLRGGQEVIAVGNPFGLGNVDGVPSVSLGSVSAVGVDRPHARDCVVTDAAINPGNSGGPLVTADGVLVGVNGQVATRFGVRANTGIGYAISSNQILRYLPALKAAGGKDVSPGAIAGASLAGSGHGRAVVRRVKRGSPAGRAGIRPGDVIRQLGPWTVRTGNHLNTLATRYPAGATVGVTVLRGGKPLRLRVALEAPKRGLLGLVFERGSRKSLKVERGVPGGPAHRAGGTPGDVVRGMDLYRFHDRQSLQAVLAQAYAGQTVHLILHRKGADLTLLVRLAPADEVRELSRARRARPAAASPSPRR
ncbi:MAG: trypsin-like peptidase domain-containing protein [Planctomycetota bacterium]